MSVVSQFDLNQKPDYDDVLQKMADYVLSSNAFSREAYDTALLCLIDSMGCAMLALNFVDCQRLLGPIVPEISIHTGAKVPGTSYELDPVQAAFNLGIMIRWLDFNDTWLAQEWGHPSDNLGAILMLADYLSRKNILEGKPALTMHQVLHWMIKAYELQGIMALENSFNRVGLDHVILVKLASAAVASVMLGADRDEVLRCLSLVFVDGQSLRTYRHAPNAGSRKSWAAGDATARGVRLALLAHLGEMGYPSALTAKTWGFYDVSFQGKSFKLNQPFSSYVIENILFKLSYPAEFHAQTAVECAVLLHPYVRDRLESIEKIYVATHESAIRIISKSGPLHNPADRDHCLQYMIAIGLIFGDLKSEHYEQDTASLPLIDQLRNKMVVQENPKFSQDYLDPNFRSIANSITINFKDGTVAGPVTVEYPIGHKRRREEGKSLLYKKFKHNLSKQFQPEQINRILDSIGSLDTLSLYSVNNWVDLWL